MRLGRPVRRREKVETTRQDAAQSAAATSQRGLTGDVEREPGKEEQMRTLLAALAIALMATITGCNTIEGAGKDLERGGEKVQDTARDVKRDM
jgi:predicted small secreted protein